MDKIYWVVEFGNSNILEVCSCNIIEKIYNNNHWKYKVGDKTNPIILYEEEFSDKFAFSASCAIMKYIMIKNDSINSVIAHGASAVYKYSDGIKIDIEKIKKAKEELEKYL